LEATSKLRKE
jgi:intraflagellar transport protein 81